MITLYLASFLETANFGSGKKYAISYTKPDNFNVDGIYTYFIPQPELMEDYYKIQENGNRLAAIDHFMTSFENQLNKFVEDVNQTAQKENKSVFELLPFSDGDTLLCWEREENTNYRASVAKILKELGYNVILK